MNYTDDRSLRPRTLVELIDQAWRIYRSNLVRFLLLFGVVTLPATIISVFGSMKALDALRASTFDNTTVVSASATGFSSAFNIGALFSALGTFVGIALAVRLIQFVLSTVLVGALVTYITSENILGRQPTVGDAFLAVRERFVPLTLGMISFYVIYAGIAILLALTLFLCGLAGGVLIYAYVAMAMLLSPVLVLERTSIIDGLGRAWALGKARVWPLTMLFAFVTIVTLIESQITGILSRALFPHASSLSASAFIFQIITLTIFGLLIAPLWSISVTVIYYDARVREEGLATLIEASENIRTRPADLPSPNPAGRFLTSSDVVNIGIMCAGTFAVALLLIAVQLLTGGSTR